MIHAAAVTAAARRKNARKPGEPRPDAEAGPLKEGFLRVRGFGALGRFGFGRPGSAIMGSSGFSLRGFRHGGLANAVEAQRLGGLGDHVPKFLGLKGLAMKSKAP